MNSFSEILNEYFEKLEITQSSAAQIIGCSRSMLYSVLSGEKNLTESKFQRMISEIPFTDEQITKLRYSYYKDKYPAGTIDRIFAINYFMSGQRENEHGIIMSPSALPDTPGTIIGEPELLRITAAIVSDEEAGIIMTNFPYENKNIDDTVFAALTGRKNHVDFRHIIEFSHSNKSSKNIANLFLSLRYIRHGFNPFYCFSDNDIQCENDLYPYFILTDRYAFFFNTHINCGMFINEESIVRSSRGIADTYLEKCEPLATYPTDVFELKSTITKVSSNKISHAFGSSACIIPFVPEMIEKIADRSLPNREFDKNRCRSLYKARSAQRNGNVSAVST